MNYIINKQIDDIEEADLKYLIDNEIIETKILDYKAELPGNSDSEKKEFLSDISSFANATGGDIFYGISQDNNTGKPQGPLNGLNIQNIDNSISRLENILVNGLEPQLPSYLYTIRPLHLSNSNYVIIIRISKSWIGPHRISFKSSHKFYSRNSNGKYLMDIHELRSVFILSETLVEKVQSFKEKRLSMIIANESHIQFNNNEILVLFLIPFESFQPGKIFDIKKVFNVGRLHPLHGSSWVPRFNIDGIISYEIFKIRTPYELSYVQFYRNGIIEAAEDYIFQIPKEKGKKLIPLIELELTLINKIPLFFETYKKIGINPPISISLHLFGLKGFSHPYPLGTPSLIDRDHLQPPDILVETYDDDIDKLLKPCFDALWNAIGVSCSPNYDEEGKWKMSTLD